MLTEMQRCLKNILPRSLYNIISRFIRYYNDLLSCMYFLLNRSLNVSIQDKIRILRKIYIITLNVDSPHTQEEILTYIQAIISLPRRVNGVVVEAGCYKGGSTAKFSLAADIAGKDLVVFDSFQGIPANNEPRGRDIVGGPPRFKQGQYCGTLNEVKANISRYGKINRCRFIAGWFDDTLREFEEPISAIYLDVDLASSTRTCLKYLYPLLEPGGVLYSQDGHLPLVISVFNDDNFWLSEVGCKKPKIHGLGKKNLIKIIKEPAHA
jgi:O-methyltransferase